MGKCDGPEYRIINDILARKKSEHEAKPRIDCPRHGLTLICAKCKKCFSCIEDDHVNYNTKSYLEFCLNKRHTFLNLFAPCNFCREQSRRVPNQYHDGAESKCEKCWDEDYKAYHKRMAEEAHQARLYPSSPITYCPHGNDFFSCDECYYG